MTFDDLLMEHSVTREERQMSDDAFEIHMQFALKEISLAQYRAQLKDLGWTDDEIDTALDDDQSDDEEVAPEQDK